MTKVIKIILIVIMCFIVAYGIKLAYGFWIWHNVSSEDQMKIAQTTYNKCIAEGREGCEVFLIRGLEASLSTQKEEAAEIVLDKTKTEEERIEALKDFYLLSRNEAEEMDETEIDFYYVITYDEENPIGLSQEAFGYLLEQATGDKKIVQIQMQIASSSDADLEYRKKAVMALGNGRVEGAANIFIQILEEEGTVPRWSASRGLINIGAIDKMPDLLRIALDENKDTSIRGQALETMDEMINLYEEAKDMTMVDKLKPLLEHKSVSIWSNTANVLESLTGEKYGRDELTEEEMEEYMSDTWENILIPGIDY